MARIEKSSRVTAETVTRDYDPVAKEVEALGAELISATQKWVAMTADVRNTIHDTADAYRQQGRKIFEPIEGVRAGHRGRSQDLRRR
jgi:hypothetical protein